ncbi:LppM family (lipo)protein [Sanguibacter suaedae]|uniref:LppM domain-containing protein n=1 Tax=Sanguibacter suaedae TaxID=2795737 RepID=A0A934I7V3_9MICO|nr:hypothetical protein [Sanguibacter suaedae]MBI9115846.1 hypothetical protein [Sanguibacter suaedae]
MKKITAVTAGLVLALTLSGCTRMHTSFTVNEDDTVDAEIVAGISEELAQAFGSTAAQMWAESVLDPTEGMPGGTQAEDYVQDGYTGTRLTFGYGSLAKFSAPDPTSDDTLVVVREGDEYVLDGSMEFTEEAFGLEGISELDPGNLSDPDLRVIVTFPAEVLETNGTVEGSTITWTPVWGETLEMTARAATVPEEPTEEPTTEAPVAEPDDTEDDSAADEESEGTNWLLWVSIAVGALALVGLVVWLVTSRRRGPGNGGTPQAAWPTQQPGVPGQAPQPPQQPQG